MQRLAARPGALVEAHDLQSVFLPLLPKGEHASPLLPYIIRPLPPGADGLPRSIAIARLRHAPFDTIGLIAARRGAGWRLVDLVVSIDQ